MIAQNVADVPSPTSPNNTPTQPSLAPVAPPANGLPPMTPPTQPTAPGIGGTQSTTPPTQGGSPGNTMVNMPPGTPNLPMTDPSTWGGSQGNTFVNSVAGQAPTSITPGSTLAQLQSPTASPSPTPVSPQVSSTGAGSPLPPPPTPSLQPAGIPIANGVNASATDPNNNLTGQTILPGQQADRFALAKSNLANFASASDPYYQKSLLDAQKSAGASGQLGSGQLRTSLGDLAYNRDLQLGAQGTSFLNDALNNSVDDAYKNIGVAQQQQGFQAGQQQTAFGQGTTQAELQNELLNGATNRASTQLTQGNAGNPADTSLILSQLFGNQASQGQNAVSGLISGTVNKNAQNATTSQLQQLLGGMLTPQNTGATLPSAGTPLPPGTTYGGVLPDTPITQQAPSGVLSGLGGGYS